MIGQTIMRKVSAAASQPPTTANPHGRNPRSNTVMTSPMKTTTAARRMAGACQPIHRWYSVGGGLAVIVGVLPIASERASSYRALLAQPELRTALLAACLDAAGDRCSR